ncbi:MAG: glutamate--tRNA ligase family protein [bacterium]|nr:glutamate--tRNA ligase family protein [bacterium]
MNSENKKVITRFAPSPTGKFHVGGVRTALYNYLYARKNNGTFILRSEDTDPARSKKEYEDYFLELFTWLGLEYDAFYRQSERTEIYKKYLEQLLVEDKAYVSKETPKEEGERAEVIRFRNPNGKVSFEDAVLGRIEFDTTELGDFVIARSLESPLYHFTVVVDDFLMGVTHIIRGQEHVSNTPRQLLIQEALGAPRPIYAHASIILNEERAKLSKRDPIVRPALEYRDEGYLPGGLMNFMALLGWNPGTEQEIFTLAELVQAFSLERLQKPGAIFNPEKLEWINKEHIRQLSAPQKFSIIRDYLSEDLRNLPDYNEDRLQKLVPTLIDHITNFGMIREMVANGDLAYYFSTPKYTKEMLKTQEFLPALINIIEGLNENNFTAPIIKEAVWAFATEKGRGNVLWPMRFALSGKEKSPDPFTLAEVLGKDETIKRLNYAKDL